MKNKDIFAKKWDNVNEEYHSTLGDDFYATQGAGDLDSMYAGGGDEFNANSNQGFTPATSRPYVFTLDNTTAGTLTDVVWMNAYQAIASGSSNNGITAGVTVSYDIPNITYVQFLQALAGGFSARIGEMYLECATTAQLTKIFQIQYTDMNGDQRSINLSPRLDPNQNQTVNLTLACDFVLDAFTKITIASLQATNDLTVSMYPKARASNSRGLVGENDVKAFSNPQINRPVRMIQA